MDTDKKKIIYIVNENLRKFLVNNDKRFKVVNAGIGVLRRVEKVSVSKFRLMQDGLEIMTPFITKRIVNLSVDDAAVILQGTNDNHYCSLDDLENPGELGKMECGSVIVRVDNGQFKKHFCVWLGAKSATAFITREEKIHCLQMMGKDASKLMVLSLSVRQKKSQPGGRVGGADGKADPENEAETVDDEVEMEDSTEKVEPNEEDATNSPCQKKMKSATEKDGF
uniref:Uncharacterized protein n=1 Tax=Panagrolaimus sp. JU765 TaxID=591449 RepID=A0AC34QRW7_9BILA